MAQLPPKDVLKMSVSALKGQIKALELLAKAGNDVNALAKALKLFAQAGTVDVAGVENDVLTYLEDEKSGRRELLSSGLREGAAKEGFELIKLSMAPLELRLPPVSARIDVEANQAEIVFSQQILKKCSASAESILAARREVVEEFEREPWDARLFHAQLHGAWKRASPGGDWAQLVDVLPELVFLRQPRAFRQDPSEKRFVAYSRAQFAYDLWRLRRDRALSQGGLRLTIAPATGNATKDKKLVFWLEDDRGQGQYHLTLRFIREETHGT